MHAAGDSNCATAPKTTKLICPNGTYAISITGTYNEQPSAAAFTSIGPLTCCSTCTSGTCSPSEFYRDCVNTVVAGVQTGIMWTDTALIWYKDVALGRLFANGGPCQYIFTVTLEGRQHCRNADIGKSCYNNDFSYLACPRGSVVVGVSVQTNSFYVVGVGLICSPACVGAPTINGVGPEMAACTTPGVAGKTCYAGCASGSTSARATATCSFLGGGWNVDNPCGTGPGEGRGS